MNDDSKTKDFELEELEKPLTEQEMKETTGGGMGQGSHLIVGTDLGGGQVGATPTTSRGFIENSVNNGGSQTTRKLVD